MELDWDDDWLTFLAMMRLLVVADHTISAGITARTGQFRHPLAQPASSGKGGVKPDMTMGPRSGLLDA
jgi:hypothetical protein